MYIGHGEFIHDRRTSILACRSAVWRIRIGRISGCLQEAEMNRRDWVKIWGAARR